MPVPTQSVAPVEPWALGLPGGRRGWGWGGQSSLGDVTARAGAGQPPRQRGDPGPLLHGGCPADGPGDKCPYRAGNAAAASPSRPRASEQTLPEPTGFALWLRERMKGGGGGGETTTQNK